MVIIDYQAAHRHGLSLDYEAARAIAASWKVRSRPACTEVGR
jgi:hypothetical protein